MQRFCTSKRIKILSVLVMMLISHAVFAIDERYAAQPMRGNQLRKDSSSTVVDTVYANNALKPLQTSFTVRNLITFKLDEFANLRLPTTFNVSISFKVYYTRNVGDTTAVLDSTGIISLGFNYDSASNYGHKAIYTFLGGHRAQVKITNISVSGTTIGVIENSLMLENEIMVNREYDFSCTGNAVQSINKEDSIVNTRGELIVNWNAERSADEYDLEWAYIDQEALTNYKLASDTTKYDPKKVFGNNATRVSLKQTEYLIPLLYDNNGVLFFRVRPVQVKQNGQRLEANWSSDYTSGLGQYAFGGHENLLNWQATTSFAEDGKRKSVVQYYDGSLRNRQTVAKDNTTDTTIVAETFHDYQGRPVIQVLPTPSLSRMIKYTPRFNKVNSGEYEKDLYDGLLADSCYCTVGAPAMDSAVGASRYYSGNNPNANNGYHQYIPRAEGFPFAETRYTPDNTNRIALQSGVGPDFQIGKADPNGFTHEIRHYYSGADQEELDALFGTEVGRASHYFKNMVRDANGQFSVNYVDMRGRTIATALAGKPFAKLDTLASNKTITITKRLLDSTNNIVKDMSIIANKSLMVTTAGNHIFNYSLQPDSIRIMACDTTDICYDCLYELEITITDDCNNSTLPNGQPIVISASNLHYSIACDTLSFPQVKDTVFLREGSYLISKKLTISKPGMEYFRDSVFMPRNTCKTLDEFIAEQKALLPVGSCVPECETCTASVGTWTSFQAQYMTDYGIAPADSANYREQARRSYEERLDYCAELCDGFKPMHKSIRAQMLADLTPPSGQYANRQKIDEYSIFKEIHANSGILSYQAGIDYKDVNGNQDGAWINGELVYAEKLNDEQFESYFKPIWAEALLPRHPEYCKLEQYEKLAASHSWDERFERTTTFKAAVDSGYLNPGNFSNKPAGSIFNFNATHQDPFFTSLITDGLVNASYKINMQDSLAARTWLDESTPVSIWALATIMTRCKSGDISCMQQYANNSTAFDHDTACSGDLDIAWQYFRGMYLQEKREVIARWLQEKCGNDRPSADHFVHFPDFSSMPDGAAADEQSARDSMQAFIDSNCYAYANQWWKEMKPCNFSQLDSAAIISRLVQVCREGGDEDHMFGSSTVRPSSTNTDRSFEQVIKEYAGANYNSTCNVYLLTAPKRYELPPLYAEKPILQKPDSCECKLIGEYFGNFQVYGQSDTTFSKYLLRTTGTYLRDGALDTLRRACKGEINCSFLKKAISLPTVFQCGFKDLCVPCLAIDTLYSNFKEEFPGVAPSYTDTDSLQRVHNKLFAAYMNDHLGFTKTAADYMTFAGQCNVDWSGNSCNSLQQLVADYKAYRRGLSGVAIAYTSEEVIHFTNLKDMVKYGAIQLPDTVRAKTESGWYNNLTFTQLGSNYCWSNGYSVEYRFRMSRSTHFGEVFYMELINAGVVFARWESGIYLFEINDRKTGINYGYEHDDTGFHQIQVSPDSNAILQYNTVRVEYMPSYIRVYWNGSIVITLSRNAAVPIDNSTTHILGMFQRWGIVDWAKLYDASGNVKYFEDFNDPESPAFPDESYLCPGTGYPDCQTQFVNYYNAARGTSYTYSQIDSVYQAKCGKPLNPCPDTLTNRLEYLKKDFNNLYYNHGIKYDSYGCDTTTWKVNYGPNINQTGIPHHEIFANGVMQVARPLGIPPISSGVDYDFKWLDTACVDGKFSLEFRMRSFDSSAFRLEMWFNSSIDGQKDKYFIVFHPYSLSTNAASFFGPTINHSFSSVSEFMQDYTYWRVAKFEMDQNVLKFYVDDTLRKTMTFPSGVLINKFYGFGVRSANSAKDKSAEWDWFKAYDKNGNIFYQEDFNSCGTFSYFAPYIRCPKQPCDQAFKNFYNQQQGTSYSYSQIDSLYAANKVDLSVCEAANNGPLLCGKQAPVAAPFKQYNSCDDSTLFATAKGTQLYKYYRDSLLASFEDRYLAKCLAARYNESFTVKQPVSEYHYTLYYYDQAGNLVKTIPPAGVNTSKFAWSLNWTDSVKTARNNKQLLTPQHALHTNYRYNTLNAVVAQHSPDGGKSEFWYDRLGRIAISRNAKQYAAGSSDDNNRLYSYTKYDILGRITEVGQVKNTNTNGVISDIIARNASSLNSWLLALDNRREQVTTTVYDLPYTGYIGFIPDGRLIIQQRNLRNRVSYVSYADAGGSNFNQATLYTYDIHGNVDTLLQDYGPSTSLPNVMNKNGNRFKKIAYKYDLVSGKVNMVMYQRGWSDQFFHRYSYDAENRLTSAETSTDSLVWERDARYEYYQHGPLARTVIGEQSVQGLDYAYTLQGWLKGINSTGATSTHDMGGDAKTGHLNQYTGQDAMGITLNYFTGEYKPVNAGVNPFPGYSASLGSANYRPLYNGNISSMSTYLRPFENNANDTTLGPIYLYNYRYDQLNRLTAMDAFRGFNTATNSWSAYPVNLNKFRERISYDANGNIKTYQRNGTSWQPEMDNLTYEYYAGTNQLKGVSEAMTDLNRYGGTFDPIKDIDPQPVSNNYEYDLIGNLTKDSSEKIHKIEWTAYGKIKQIIRIPTPQNRISTITYSYDAQGNRIGTLIERAAPYKKEYQWYVRDAQGNVMAVYKTDTFNFSTPDSFYLSLAERHIYGSSRVGLTQTGTEVDNNNAGPATMQFYNAQVFNRGRRQYELTNHLGNVLAVISDKKLGVPSGGIGSLISYYKPDIITAQDYYPFGMVSRLSGGLGYRYGFNGKEVDNSVKGYGNQQDYGMRISDPRLGRFLSVDPVSKQYPELTPYQFASNRPIDGIDRDGLEWYYKNAAFGWTESKIPKPLFLTEKEANAAGYLSAQQLHTHLFAVEKINEAADHDRRLAAYNKDLPGRKMKFNPVFAAPMALFADPASAAIEAFSDGRYLAGTMMLATLPTDFAPLFKTFGKGYAAVAKGFADGYETLEDIFAIKNNFVRGALAEAKLAVDYVAKGFDWLAETSPFFRTIDFYSAKGVGISLKTVNAEKSFTFENIFKNINELAAMKKAGSTVQYGVEYKITSVELHIATPAGYDRSVLKEVKAAAEKAGVIFEYCTP